SRYERRGKSMSLDLGLTGKVAIVTGGSVGIGKETARKLAAEGVAVVIASRTATALEQAAAEIRSGTKGTLVARTAAELGSVDILVNCAAAPGGLVRNDLAEADEDALLLDLNTKLVGYF